MKLLLTTVFLLTLMFSFSFAQYSCKTIALDEGGKKVSSGNFVSGLCVGQQIASNFLTSGQYRAVISFWNPVTAPHIGIEEKDFQMVASFPLVFNLSQCQPNPFSNKTTIRYSIPKETEVNLHVFNTAGRVVRTLVSGKQKPGIYNVTWNLKGVSQSLLPNGVYFYRLEAGEFKATKKMVKVE
uniref:T9SS type A sorting domain-containing protein n=1 Tax=candidate division WOR-3 bacterium TaxID=2052148 RepID=A0A7C6EDW0_UNCW3